MQRGKKGEQMPRRHKHACLAQKRVRKPMGQGEQVERRISQVTRAWSL